jgi:sugar phosphate isomerase/epimerase
MRVGLQMYSVREAFASDPLGTLSRIAEIGYHHVEFANHHADRDPGVGFDIPADKLRKQLEQTGIKPIGSHISPFPREDRQLDRVIAYHRDLGSESIAISIDFWNSRREVLEACKFYNHVGERSAKAGLAFYFHNHFHEFQQLDGERVLDTIVANTKPENLGIELDAYWTFRGAIDPAEKIREYRQRVKVIHQKDFPFSQARYLDIWTEIDPSKPLDTVTFHKAIHPEHFTEIGDGMMKVQDIVDAGNEANARYLLVEQDHGRMASEFDRIARGLANLKKLAGLAWA